MEAHIQAAIEGFIKRSSHASGSHIEQAQRLSGGAIQENWLIKVRIEGGQHAGLLEAVVRTDAPSGVSTSHSRAEEFALLKTVFAAGVTVPEPLWLCEDDAIIGRPFFIMRRIGGSAAGHVLVKQAARHPDLAERLGAELARIHSIKPPQPALAFLPPTGEQPALRLIRRWRDFLDRHPTPYPVLEWGLRWLERHAPATGEVTLCHRDFRTGNYMVDECGLTGILDWEFADWSDPMEDIGWFCAKCWRFGANDREAGGIGEREDFYRGYERVSGKALDRKQVHYWEVIAHVNWAVIAIQQAQRHLSGQEHSLLLALTGHLLPELEWEILNLTEAS